MDEPGGSLVSDFCGAVDEAGELLLDQELEEQLLTFITYFNEALANPFRWTYTGRPLRL